MDALASLALKHGRVAGIDRSRVEDMESRLRADVLREVDPCSAIACLNSIWCIPKTSSMLARLCLAVIFVTCDDILRILQHPQNALHQQRSAVMNYDEITTHMLAKHMPISERCRASATRAACNMMH